MVDITILENVLLSRNLALEPGKLGSEAGCHLLTRAGLFLLRRVEIIVFSSGLSWGLCVKTYKAFSCMQ